MKPMTLKEFYAKIEASQKAYREGRIITHEDLKEKVKTWKEK